jgi:uncharacterized protein YegJ (DUF2314 family)
VSDLVPVFMPQLAALLIASEDHKGSPLTETEVIAIRDRAACIMMARDRAEALWKQRGRDVDPDNAWYDFQMLRRHLRRKPELDPGQRVGMFASDDPAMTAAMRKAKATISEFIATLRDKELPALIKVSVDQGGQRRFIWLGGVHVVDGELDAVVAPGQRRRVPHGEVFDWMINEDGAIRGGFTLRVQREQLPPEEHASFDEQLGARTWL